MKVILNTELEHSMSPPTVPKSENITWDWEISVVQYVSRKFKALHSGQSMEKKKNLHEPGKNPYGVQCLLAGFLFYKNGRAEIINEYESKVV